MVFTLMTLTLTHSLLNQRKCVLTSMLLLTVGRQTGLTCGSGRKGSFLRSHSRA